jgi:hypothetical protein
MVMRIRATRIFDHIDWLGANVGPGSHASQHRDHDTWHVWTAQAGDWRVIKAGNERTADIWCRNLRHETHIGLKWS